MERTVNRNRKYPSYRERLYQYETEKRHIAETSKSSAEYERRLSELSRRLHV